MLTRIRGLSWRQFETLIGQHFREMGYSVADHGGGGPDDGVDLALRSETECLVVQCKHWKTLSVGIREVKELFATVKDREATGGVLVATSAFSVDARTFASRHPEIRLLDGRDLTRLLESEIRDPEPAPAPDLSCPRCKSAMVKRTARTGPGAGNEFFGCSLYPACRGTRSMPAAQ